jgi:ABC-type branched-subunit amino acid transport system substrate-binding protein
MAAYRRLARAHRLSSEHLATQLAALAEARILHETLVRAGRELSREKLVEALEGMYDFQTGFSGTISFGPNRRIGSDKVALTRLDSVTGHLQPLPQ